MLTTLSAMIPRPTQRCNADEALVSAAVEAMSAFDHADASLASGAPLSTISSSTTFAANRRKFQRAWPSGGLEQASAVSRAWALPSKIGLIGGVARFLRARTA